MAINQVLASAMRFTSTRCPKAYLHSLNSFIEFMGFIYSVLLKGKKAKILWCVRCRGRARQLLRRNVSLLLLALPSLNFVQFFITRNQKQSFELEPLFLPKK